jgi:hypothetical protein
MVTGFAASLAYITREKSWGHLNGRNMAFCNAWMELEELLHVFVISVGFHQGSGFLLHPDIIYL